ncbi:MAG: hypothetical protein MHPSP_000604, partial [Paramarteilia canceri]
MNLGEFEEKALSMTRNNNSCFSLFCSVNSHPTDSCIGFTSKNLLEIGNEKQCLCVDATYNLNLNDFP